MSRRILFQENWQNKRKILRVKHTTRANDSGLCSNAASQFSSMPFWNIERLTTISNIWSKKFEQVDEEDKINYKQDLRQNNAFCMLKTVYIKQNLVIPIHESRRRCMTKAAFPVRTFLHYIPLACGFVVYFFIF